VNPHDDSLGRRALLRRAAQATATVAASASMGSVAATLSALAGEASPSPGRRISYYCNGEIHVNEVGKPEGRPLTTGYMDFKPSWSKTGEKLVFFRRYKDDPVTVNWLSAICIISVDGTGFHQLTDATIANFNPTWTRDGHNSPIWNRKNPKTGSFYVMQSKIGGHPGEEVALTDETYHTWAYSSLTDGRIVVSCNHPKLGWGYYLMTCGEGGKPQYERIACTLTTKGLLDRVSVSPSEEKVCFEFQKGFVYRDPGRTLYIADFDPHQRSITNLRPIANEDGKPFWYAYPRWIEGDTAVVYHMMNQSGKGQLFLYRLQDGSTKRVSANAGADYRYPHGEAAPC
jgi:Tol biopolymer transport system component